MNIPRQHATPVLLFWGLQLLFVACTPRSDPDAVTLIPIQNLNASGIDYTCGTYEGAPATIARTPDGNTPMIRWISEYFTPSGWTPKMRCDEVSQRFNRFHQQGLLAQLTTGNLNDLPVICAPQFPGGDCGELLLTLEPQEAAAVVLQDLVNPEVAPIQR